VALTQAGVAAKAPAVVAAVAAGRDRYFLAVSSLMGPAFRALFFGSRLIAATLRRSESI
jgi:hypothetical protein